jgi:hypothetical protein
MTLAFISIINLALDMEYSAPSSHAGPSDRKITPRTYDSGKPFKPYQEQTRFRYGAFDSREVLDSKAVAVLKHAISTARLLGTSQRGLAVHAYEIDKVVDPSIPDMSIKTISSYKSSTIDRIKA